MTLRICTNGNRNTCEMKLKKSQKQKNYKENQQKKKNEDLLARRKNMEQC